VEQAIKDLFWHIVRNLNGNHNDFFDKSISFILFFQEDHASFDQNDKSSPIICQCHTRISHRCNCKHHIYTHLYCVTVFALGHLPNIMMTAPIVPGVNRVLTCQESYLLRRPLYTSNNKQRQMYCNSSNTDRQVSCERYSIEAYTRGQPVYISSEKRIACSC
jgi:hypothetical protein